MLLTQKRSSLIMPLPCCVIDCKIIQQTADYEVASVGHTKNATAASKWEWIVEVARWCWMVINVE